MIESSTGGQQRSEKNFPGPAVRSTVGPDEAKEGCMPTDQYHEPAAELSTATRTFARMCANLTEEAEAIGWYEQRISLEPDADARAIMLDSLGEEFKHFSMDLEFLLRANPVWRRTAKGILFTAGDIVENGGRSEAAAATGQSDATSPPQRRTDASLGIGSLKGGAS
jgi:uncharacterized protein